MKALEDLREMLCSELDEIARKPEMSAGDLEAAHKLTDTIKNIDKICLLEEGYSQAGDWEITGRGNYERGNSYANRGKHYVRAHYSRNGDYGEGMSYGRTGRYSRDDAKEHMRRELQRLQDEAQTDREHMAIQRCIDELERN